MESYEDFVLYLRRKHAATQHACLPFRIDYNIRVNAAVQDYLQVSCGGTKTLASSRGHMSLCQDLTTQKQHSHYSVLGEPVRGEVLRDFKSVGLRKWVRDICTRPSMYVARAIMMICNDR